MDVFSIIITGMRHRDDHIYFDSKKTDDEDIRKDFRDKLWGMSSKFNCTLKINNY